MTTAFNFSKFIYFTFFILFLHAFKVVNAKEDEILQCQYNKNFVDVNHESTPIWHRDQQSYLSPYALYQMTSSKDKFKKLIVDIRVKREFQNRHIQGAFNLPFHSLLTKTIFKDKEIILVGNGDDYKYLEILRIELMIRGFKNVKILDGGMNFWSSKIEQKQMSADLFKLTDLSKLLNGDKNHWSIVDSTDNHRIKEKMSNVMSFADKNIALNPQSVKKAIEKNNTLIGNVLLVVEKQFYNKKTLDLWQSTLKANTYIIESNRMNTVLNEYYDKQRLMQYKQRADGTKMTCL